MKQVVVPYVGMERVIEVLDAMYDAKTNEEDLLKLAVLLNCKASNINNVTPTLRLLGLATRKGDVIRLTDRGSDLINAMRVGNKDKAKEIVRNAVEQSEALGFVRSLLENRKQLNGEEIGRAIADRYGRSWKSIATYRAFGNSCATILAFAGLGYYRDGVITLEPPTEKALAEIYPPEAGAGRLLKLLKLMYPYQRATVGELAEKLGPKSENQTRMWNELHVLQTLGLVAKGANGSYSITDAGMNLIDPGLPEQERTASFRSVLMNSPYGEVIMRLASRSEDFTYQNLGGLLGYLLRRDWKDMTQLLYGKKLASWLLMAGLAERLPGNRLKIRKPEILEDQTKERQQRATKASVHAFELGRLIGVLEQLLPDKEPRRALDDTLVMLKSHTSGIPELKGVLELLPKHFAIALESSNYAAYQTDLSFIKESLKELTEVSS